jgi:hypothetical protein
VSERRLSRTPLLLPDHKSYLKVVIFSPIALSIQLYSLGQVHLAETPKHTFRRTLPSLNEKRDALSVDLAPLFSTKPSIQVDVISADIL